MLYYSILIAFFGSFLFGYTTCIIAGALIFLSQEFELTPLKEGVLVSILLIGAMMGSWMGSFISKKRPALIISGCIFILGIFLSMIQNYPMILLGRFITGIATGLVSMIVPLYLAEISPPAYRGRIGSLTNLGIALGIFIAYIVSYFYSQSGHWQFMFAMGLIPASVLFIGMFFAKESPHAHIKNVPFTTLFHSYKKLLITGGILSLSQQITGINAVNYYAPQIFLSVGFNAPSLATLATICIGFIYVVFSLIAARLVDHWGRKPLLSISLSGMAISLAILAIAYAIKSPSIAWIAIILIPLYAGFFTLGMGAIVWIYLSEMFPSKVRNIAMSVVVSINWMGNFVVSLLFPPLQKMMGIEGVFALFAILSVMVLCWVQTLKETKGLELD